MTNPTLRPRRRSVWVVLSLQTALTVITAYSCVRILALWSRFGAMHAQLVFRETVLAAMLGVSLVALWSDKSWGWILALVADGAMCAEALWFVLNYPGLYRSPRFLAFNILEFAAFAALLHTPVREHFFGGRIRARANSSAELQSSASHSYSRIRVVLYFAVAVVVTCTVTAFSLALFMGSKSGGSQGFLMFLLFGITTGGVAALVFAFLLTAVGRQFGPNRVGIWLLSGALVAPAVVVTMAVIGRLFLLVPLLNFVFWGPATLVQIWWLTPPIGVVTGWICYLMYPWAYSPVVSTQLARSARFLDHF